MHGKDDGPNRTLRKFDGRVRNMTFQSCYMCCHVKSSLLQSQINYEDPIFPWNNTVFFCGEPWNNTFHEQSSKRKENLIDSWRLKSPCLSWVLLEWNMLRISSTSLFLLFLTLYSCPEEFSPWLLWLKVHRTSHKDKSPSIWIYSVPSFPPCQPRQHMLQIFQTD